MSMQSDSKISFQKGLYNFHQILSYYFANQLTSTFQNQLVLILYIKSTWLSEIVITYTPLPKFRIIYTSLREFA